MRISNETRYSHPVLSPFTSDYSFGEFSLDLSVSENPESGDLSLSHQISLTEVSILSLVETGQAEVGFIIQCLDTYHIHLYPLSYPTGLTEFPAGSLINTVTIRPIIWAKSNTKKIESKFIHQEFGDDIYFKKGDLIAIDSEYRISVGQAKLAKAESIFELQMSPETEEGVIKIDLDHERIHIIMAPETYSVIAKLRSLDKKSSVVMNSIYLPAVMETLDILRNNRDTYADRRWYKPFKERCIFKGVSLEGDFSTIDAAQILLASPISSLKALTEEDKDGE